MKITFLDTATVADLPDELARFRELGDYVAYEGTAPDQVVERLSGSDVAIVNKVVLGEEELADLPDLKLICVAATGTNNIDHAAAARRSIPVRNVAGYSTVSVAQLTITSLFALAMDLIHLNASVYDGTYASHHAFAYWRQPFYELGGARFGIIGLGTIGRRVAEIASSYGAKVVYHSTSGRYTDDEHYPHLSLDELLATSEVVSVHCPLNESTSDLIGLDQFKAMRSSAYLLNLGRGGIVNETALAAAIDAEMIAGAACDVFTTEPIPTDHPYLAVKHRHRLLLTPHVGWASVEARTELLAGVRKNIEMGFDA
ncbi:MAG: NAD(P)-dependent oxidoreductase [Planctomycetota bacterium]